ncbi:hypothetical protein Bbelb_112920 [Branchiostoma belcheri]|nr:hypothetical protein Bbelb_112920 [Branchiostoma belcheri]
MPELLSKQRLGICSESMPERGGESLDNNSHWSEPERIALHGAFTGAVLKQHGVSDVTYRVSHKGRSEGGNNRWFVSNDPLDVSDEFDAFSFSHCELSQAASPTLFLGTVFVLRPTNNTVTKYK